MVIPNPEIAPWYWCASFNDWRKCAFRAPTPNGLEQRIKKVPLSPDLAERFAKEFIQDVKRKYTYSSTIAPSKEPLKWHLSLASNLDKDKLALHLIHEICHGFYCAKGIGFNGSLDKEEMASKLIYCPKSLRLSVASDMIKEEKLIINNSTEFVKNYLKETDQILDYIISI